MSTRENDILILREYLGSPCQRYGINRLPKPFMIEFTGSPSSGKTTIIREVERLLRRSGFRVFCPQESMEAIRHLERDGKVYDARVATYALNIVIDCASGSNFDFVLLDRGLFDVYCWQEYWHVKGRITYGEKDVMQRFFLDPAWIENIDFVLFVVCEGKVAFDREYNISATNKPGGKTNPESLDNFFKSFQQSFRQLAYYRNYSQIDIIDTTHLSKLEMIEQAVDKIMKFLTKRIQLLKPIEGI